MRRVLATLPVDDLAAWTSREEPAAPQTAGRLRADQGMVTNLRNDETP